MHVVKTLILQAVKTLASALLPSHRPSLFFFYSHSHQVAVGDSRPIALQRWTEGESESEEGEDAEASHVDWPTFDLPTDTGTREVCASIKRDLLVWQKRPTNTGTQEVCTRSIRDLPLTSISPHEHWHTRGMHTWHTRPTSMAKRSTNTGTREVCTRSIRDLLVWQKRLTNNGIPRHTDVCAKDQKRPYRKNSMAKGFETLS